MRGRAGRELHVERLPIIFSILRGLFFQFEDSGALILERTFPLLQHPTHHLHHPNRGLARQFCLAMGRIFKHLGSKNLIFFLEYFDEHRLK